MKGLFSICLIIFMLIGIVGCKSDSNLNNSDSKSSRQESKHSNEQDKTSDISSDASSENSEAQSTTASDVEENDAELDGIDKLRPDYNLGDCKTLSGTISVIVFYLNDFESSWTVDEATRFTENEIQPGLKFLENSAKKYRKALNFKIKEVHTNIFYDERVEVDINQSGLATVDTLYAAAKHVGYKSDEDLMQSYRKKYKTEIICYCVFNKEGTSYGLNPKRGTDLKIAEHGLIFAYDIGSTGFGPVGGQSSVIAHETLHLYGAEDYYSPAQRKALVKEYYPNDIMLSCEYYLSENDLGDATAFFIGWTDIVPDILYDSRWNGE